MIGIVHTDASGDALELLSPRVGRREMTLHVPEQGWHLTKFVVGRARGRGVEPLRRRACSSPAR